MKGTKKIFLFLRLLVTVGVSWWVWTRLEGNGNTPFELILSHPSWIFAVPAAVIAVNTLIHTLRLWLLFKASAQVISFKTILSAILKSHFIGLVLPVGGADLIKISYLSNVAGSSLAAGMLGLARLLEMIPWGGALLFGGLVLWRMDWMLGVSAIGCGVALLFICASGLWFSQQKISHWSRVPQRIRNFVERLEAGLQSIGRQPMVLWRVSALGICFLGMNTLCIFVLCRVYAHPMRVLDVLTLFPFVDFMVSLPISLNGVGIRESVYPMLLSFYGLGMDIALAIAWTRWTGELFRAGVGGILFLIDRSFVQNQ